MRLALVGLTLILLFSLYFINKMVKSRKGSTLIFRFKRRLKKKNILKDRITEEFINSLVENPESNISIGTWYSENELREKADIHRARLNKFGRSKMNGEMIFLGSQGEIYKVSPEGKRVYV